MGVKSKVGRLAPCWVPRAFLVPGRRLKLHPDDLYAFGAHRGGIDERWLASTTEAANEGRTPDEGLSWVVHGRDRFTLREAVASAGPRLLGREMWRKYRRWPVRCKFFDNRGPFVTLRHFGPDAWDAKVYPEVGARRGALKPAGSPGR
jgi:hypothetical protein